MEATDARLASLYDIDNPDGADHGYWRALAADVAATTIIDLGCGTGLLTVTLASPGRTTVGIDPDEGMLAVAKARPGGDAVEWRLGDSRCINGTTAQLVLMTGNVAQHIGPRDWRRTLADIGASLGPGGVLGFETRNPAAEAWRNWTPAQTRGTRPTAFGQLTQWFDVTEPDEHGTVLLTAHNIWTDTNEELAVTQSLTFRTLEALVDDLEDVGLSVRAVRGGWNGEAFESTSELIVMTAEKTA